MEAGARWRHGGTSDGAHPLREGAVATGLGEVAAVSWGMSWGMLTSPCSSPQDDDAHMDFIMAASNLRAENYGIPHADWLTVRGVP